ncbi:MULTISPECIES: phage tail tape measure protein [Marinobacter]|uniref:phage tail tape measure protein n=4 Tax=Marinobacteraceae TaxID=2887365 RepID=UPI00294283FE|nr:phage tail tape measure protein [Marinobacter salarius]WOI18116.1 phage tail tape measure protein [Marinobacter salarius]
MADTSKTVEIIFGGVDKTGNAISSVGKNLDGLTNRVGDLTGPLANITDSIVKLDAALAAAAVGVTAYAIKISDDFDTAFGEIATLIGQPADNLRDFQDQILSYSETSTASLDQITNATYSAISAGTDYKDSLELLAAAEQLSIAGRADLGDTTTALVSTMNAFGASADEAGDYADNFFTAVQLGQTTIPELASSMGRLSPIAAAAGLSFEEMAAAIATITAETGTSTPEAITGIRAAITALLKPTSEARDVAAELGIEFNAAALESKGFAGVLADVMEATGGNTEVIAQLFGSVEALAPVLALGGNAAEKFAENLIKFTQNTGSAKTASEELVDTLGLLGQTLVNNLESALIGVGGRLTDETRSIVTSLTSIFNSLGNEIKLDNGAFSPILDALEGLAGDIDRKMQTIAENFPEALANLDLSQLLASFGDLSDELGNAFTNVFGDIDLDTVEGLEQALQRVVDAFTALVNISAGIVDGLQPLFQAIGKGIEEFEDLDESTKRNVGELLGLSKAIDTVLPALSALGGGLDSVGTGLTALAGAQGFKALLGNLNSVKAIAKSAGKGGLVGAALAGGYGVGLLINEFVIDPMEKAFGTSIGSWLYEQFNADEIEKIKEQLKPLTEEEKKLAKQTGELRDLNDRLAEKLEKTATATEDTQKAWQDYANELVNAANKQNKLNDAIDGTDSNLARSGNAIDQLTDKASKNGDALGEVGRTTKELADNNETLTLGYDKATGKVNSWSGAIIKSGKSVSDAATKTQDLVTNTESYRLELEKIDSNERIKMIEASVSLDIAEVEANADKVVALAESITEAFGDSTSLIGDLFGGFDEASRSTQLDIASQIRKENKFREEALEMQQKLTKAEIDYIKAKTKQANSGDALVKVDGSGLQPHLEAFMFEILSAIQVRVNADGEEMLLGLRDL